MSRKRRHATARIYTKRRDHLGRPRYYGDFRAYRAVGGRLEALRRPNERHAVTALNVAEELYSARLTELKQLLKDAQYRAVKMEPKAPLRLVQAFEQHLAERAASGNLAHGTLLNDEKAAKNLHRILGDIALRDINAKTLAKYVRERRAHGHQKSGRPLSNCTLRNELHALKGLLKRAVFEGEIPKHPMVGWADFPVTPDSHRRSLSRDEARALLIGAAREDARVKRRWMHPSYVAKVGCCDARGRRVPPPPPHAHTHAEALIATLLYTGGRSREVSGLCVADVDFETSVIYIRENRFRRLKRAHSARAVPMPTPLKSRLAAHIAEHRLLDADAIFPNAHGIAVAQINGIIRRCARLGNLTVQGLSAHCLRHTFATVMLRTTHKTAEGGSVLHTPYEVAKLLGHRRSDLVETVYAHWNPTMPIEARLDFEPRRSPAATSTPLTRRPTVSYSSSSGIGRLACRS